MLTHAWKLCNVEFIPATKQHYIEIINLASSPEELYLVSPAAKYPWDIEQLEEISRRRQNLTVALVNGVVAAFANLYDVIPNDTAFIGNVIVSDQFKGRGIGKALCHHMNKICVFEHNAVPHISVFSNNSKALLLYTKIGFIPYEVEARKNLNDETIALIKMFYEPKVGSDM
jgi:ribosomal protein S18 acetylase RimI-like enzyme